MKPNNHQPFPGAREDKIKEIRKFASSGCALFDPKRTGHFLTYKDVPKFHIEFLYRKEIASLAMSQKFLDRNNMPKSRPSTSQARTPSPGLQAELKQETLGKQLVVSKFALTQAKNPNTNHNQATVVSSGFRYRKKLRGIGAMRSGMFNRGITGMSLSSTITSPGRTSELNFRIRTVVELPSAGV